jgi:hypothetical protein
MGIKPRTIDNLGIEASRQYAKNQEALDQRLVEESRYFPSNVEGGLAPYISAGGEESFKIFSIGLPTAWATFSAPENYSVAGSRLFTHQMLPTIGGSEKLQANIDKLDILKEKIPPDDPAMPNLKIMLSHFTDMKDDSRTFELIKGRCNQYQKG